MSEGERPSAFLDASALYPSLLRNLLMRLAMRDLFRAFWSQRVQDEWTRAVLRDRPDLTPLAIERTRRLMDENIDDAAVSGYEHLIETVTLPDPDDRHVLAAAIHCAVTPTIGRKDAALPWTFWCFVHGARLWAHKGQPMESVFPPSVLERLDPLARRGAARLAAWALDLDPAGEAGAPTVPDLLQFLTTSYRRASPPSLAEQPRLSLEARRANHGFLTQPITRQALLVVAPEYNRFAPVLAKPVRLGLDALARGGLSRNYALAVAVARLTENPVEYAAATLAAADTEGEANLRRALRSWPLATRRRIDAHLRRLLAAETAVEVASGRAKGGRMATQSPKLGSSPGNFGAVRPKNCESKSRNYARARRAAGSVP